MNEKATGKKLGTVLGKPIHVGALNKNTSTGEKPDREALQGLWLAIDVAASAQKPSVDTVKTFQVHVEDRKIRVQSGQVNLKWRCQCPY